MRLEIGFVSVLVVSITIWCVIHRLKQLGKPGFRTWPLIGATVDLLVNYHQLFDWLEWNLRVMKQSTIRFPLLNQAYVVIVDPANLEHVLKTNFANYPKGETFHDRLEPLLGNGIFNSDGHVWKIQRKTASFEFASKVLREFSTKVFRDHAVVLANIVEGARAEERALEMQDLLMRMTLDTICKLGFGVDLGVLSPELPENEFARAFDQSSAILSYRFVDPVWKVKRFLKVGDERHLPGFIKTVDDLTYKIISQRRKQLQTRQESEKTREDLLSRFMLLEENFSDRDLRDIVLNFIIAGRDTTAGTLTHLIWMIASHPECAQNLYQELVEFEQRHSPQQSSDEELPLFEKRLQKFASLLTFNSLPELVYLHAVINETLRLFPAVPLNPKEVASPAVLPDGTRLKPGDYVSYFPYGMGRSESLWGSDATEFRPERWRSSNGEWDFTVSAFKLSAFQAGPRICLGKDSAYLQIRITAAILCRFFKFELLPDQVFKHNIMITLTLANGVKVIPSNIRTQSVLPWNRLNRTIIAHDYFQKVITG